ncbi:hypothetical membrane protein [Treponema paraluiscuniculi Cuniculi A]|uniref:Hypothetical membrane protein n=1 Tax=Treponema paraluiscuniculi (strain Cuniculi A) TaxID=545776 RepID=F7XSH5_TREPU|nr:hypothetical membrane protein [Treponema paraluiscuniculi Cuniculi A]
MARAQVRLSGRFLALGGYSLYAVGLVLLLYRAVGVYVWIHFYQNQTLSQLSTHARSSWVSIGGHASLFLGAMLLTVRDVRTFRDDSTMWIAPVVLWSAASYSSMGACGFSLRAVASGACGVLLFAVWSLASELGRRRP